MDYSKTLTSPPSIITSLKEIRGYTEKCEKRLDLENVEVWSKAYSPSTRKTEIPDNYCDLQACLNKVGGVK